MTKPVEQCGIGGCIFIKGHSNWVGEGIWRGHSWWPRERTGHNSEGRE